MTTAPSTTYLDHLTPHEGAQVLSALLAAHPALRTQAEELAHAELSDVDPARVAREVVERYLGQSFLEIGDRAGRRPGRGYIHEADAQWELLEEALAPFVEDVRRLGRAGLPEAAARQAQGMVAGIERLRKLAGEQTLIGWGALDDHVEGLLATVEHTCREVGVPGT